MRVLRRLASVLILASGTIMNTAASAEPPRLFNGEGISWILKPLASQSNNEVSRARLGQFLFLQPLQPPAEAIPQAGQTGDLPGLFHTTMATVQLDEQHFTPVSGGLAVTPYCSTGSIKHAGQRLCLIDTNNDGVFDYRARAFGLGNGKPFASMMFARAETASIPYTLKKSDIASVMNGGVVVRKEGDSYSLRFAVSENGKPNLLEMCAAGSGLLSCRRPHRTTIQQPRAPRVLDGTTEKFRAADIPVRIEYLGPSWTSSKFRTTQSASGF